MSGYLVNQYDGLDGLEYKVLEHLMLNNEDIWKLLKYNSPDALSKNNLTLSEKRKLIYSGNGNAESFRAFIEPYIDDAFKENCSMIRVYVDSIFPELHIMATVNICVDIVVHNKISNIQSDDNIVPIKNRANVLLKNVLQALNGAEVNGIGRLSFSRQISLNNKALLSIWNNRNFYGYTVVMSTKIANVKDGVCDG